ncbi:nucleotidyltransferase family protein [Pararoseomonas indoligenes]|uniref:nucleotidyltransferase family protein n=1 Tax=Roseomonas indoligenes TaxID=2820811 RepID=UPI001FD745B0|nr:nucleotidyltransferase family protein [Pararoseomonas indoligenes]
MKIAAASRGETVQGLVGSLVERFLAEEAGAAPLLAVVLRQLREQADDLRARGVASLSVFGSVARGDAHPGSDIDLLADLDPAARLSLIRLSSLRAELSELLGAPADLVERGTLRPGVRDAAEREAVRVW